MIKIIKEPLKKVHFFQMTCPNCDCIFQADEEDCVFGKDINHDTTVSIKCPWCNKKNVYTRISYTKFTTNVIDYSKYIKLKEVNPFSPIPYTP